MHHAIMDRNDATATMATNEKVSKAKDGALEQMQGNTANVQNQPGKEMNTK